MKKLMLAVASAVAIGLTAQAAEWFNGGIAEGWPNASTLSGGAWSNTDDTTYAGGVLDIDATDETPLTFTATEAKGPATSLSVEVSMTVTFTPFAEVIAVPDGAKAGMIIAADKYYGIGKVEDAAAWVELGAASNVDQPKNIKVTLTADGLVYSVDGTVFPVVTPVSDESFQYVKMTGTGTLASLSAVEDPGVATVNGKPYATVAEAFAAAKDGDTVKIVNAGTAALDPLKTAATTVDLNGQLVNLTGITFTNATGNVVIKNGEFDRYGNTKITFTVPAGKGLRLENLTSWAIIVPVGGDGATFEMTNCRILVGKTDKNTFAPEQDDTVATKFGSQRLEIGSSAKFAKVDIFGNEFQWGNRPPISASGAPASMVFFIYNNDFNGTTNHNDSGESALRYPSVQANNGGAAFYFENNRYFGKMAQGCFGTYNTSANMKFVVSGNTFGAEQLCMSGANAGECGANVKVFFGANDTSAATQMSFTTGYYKKEFTNPWSSDVNITLPEGVSSFRAWLNGDDAAKPYCIDGTMAEDLSGIAVGSVIIAQPGVEATVDPTQFSLTQDATYVNKWTVAAPVSAVDVTVTLDAGIASASYTKNGGESVAIASGEKIEGLAAKDALVFTVTDADGTHFFAANVVSGDLVAGTATANSFAFTVKDSLTTGAAEISLTAQVAFIKAVALDGGASQLVKEPMDAWVFFTNGTHYVELLKDWTVSGGANQLRIMTGDVALIKRNGKSVRFFANGNVCTVEDVAGADYQKFTAYASLSDAWTAKKSGATYWIGSCSSTAGGEGCTKSDASVVTLTDDALVFAGEFAPNCNSNPMGGLNNEPVTAASTTNAWGIAADGWTFRYEIAASGPKPDDPTKGDVVKEDDGSYTVKPASGTTVMTLTGVKAGDTVNVPTSLDSISGVAGATVVVKNASGMVIPNGAFVGGTEGTFSLTLNESAVVTVGTEEIPVKPTLTDAADDTKPLVVGETVEVGVKAIPGLTYNLLRSDAPATAKTGDTVAQEVATSTRVSLADPMQGTKPPKAFYVIQVAK